MADGEDGGVGEYCLAHEYANVDRDFGDAAVRNALFLNEPVVLIHQQEPELLGVQVLHHGVHVVVDAGGGAQVGTLLGLFLLAALAQLAGSKDGDGLGSAYAVVLTQVVNGFLAKGVQIVVAISQDAFHQANSVFL